MRNHIGKATIVLSAMAAGNFYAAPVDAMGGASCVSSNLTMSVIRSPLDFASITPCTASSGQVSVAPNQVRTTTGCITGTAGTIQSAQVSVGGTSGQVVISVTGATFPVVNGGNSMNVTGYDFKIKGGGPTITVNLPQTTVIGAVVNVGAGQVGGTYTGSFNVRATCK